MTSSRHISKKKDSQSFYHTAAEITDEQFKTIVAKMNQNVQQQKAGKNNKDAVNQ